MLEYGFIRVGCSSCKLEVGNPLYNQKEITNIIKKAKNQEIAIIVFPELSITGYTAGDLFLTDTLIDSSLKALESILNETKNIDIISIIGLPIRIDNQLFNCATVINKGKILGIIPKTHIPNYREFNEKRWFSSSDSLTSTSIKILKQEVLIGTDLLFIDEKNPDIAFSVEICEDLWNINSPSDKCCQNGATIIFNLSASNEVIGKYDYRRKLIEMKSSNLICAYIYTSSGIYESTTDLVFSGETLIYENGLKLEEGERFSLESTIIYNDVDVLKLANIRRRDSNYMKNNTNFLRTISINVSDSTSLIRKYSKYPFVPLNLDEKNKRCQEIIEIQASGLCKRIMATNIKKTIIGISGGLDSTLALLVILRAYHKLGISNDNIIAVTMPGFGTSNRTLNNALKLMELYHVTIKKIDIKKSCLINFKNINHDKNIHDATYENVQARERTKILMDLANKEQALVIGTSDLSELILGWCTYDGDHMSMYSVNSSIPKTLVKYLIENFALEEDNLKKKAILDILNTPISPELLPLKKGEIVQKSEESIGPYNLHDFFIYHFFKYGASIKKIYYLACLTFSDIYNDDEIKHWLKVFIKRFFTNQFKRNSLPDGVKVGTIGVSPRGDLRIPSDASYSAFLDELE